MHIHMPDIKCLVWGLVFQSVKIRRPTSGESKEGRKEGRKEGKEASCMRHIVNQNKVGGGGGGAK